MVSAMFRAMILNKHDALTVRQMAILFAVSQNSYFVREISEKLNIPISSVSKCCDTLQRHGYINREPRGRQCVIKITPTGDASIGKTISAIAKATL